MLVAEVVVFAFTLWLGAYLYSRDPADARLTFTARGLLLYALALAGEILIHHAPHPFLTAPLVQLTLPLYFLPPLFWCGAILMLLPERDPIARRLQPLAVRWVAPAAAVLYAVGLTRWVLEGSQPGRAYWLIAAAVGAELALALALWGIVWRRRGGEMGRPLALALVATLFFTLGMGLYLFPLGWLSRSWLVLGLGGDLLLLGIVIARFDAFEEGEALWLDLVRSLVAAGLLALLFGGQVAFVLGALGGSLPLLALLLTTVAAAILLYTFGDVWQAAVDRLVLARSPEMQRARAAWRGVATAVPQPDPTLDPAALDEEAFVRMTRRALSHLGNLPKLAASPLTALPLVEARLAQRAVEADTLARANELRALLVEAIERLRPPGEEAFSPADEWRFYNALYYPYVIGLKPFSRRALYESLDEAAEAALSWFQSQVPERTLYNWQNAAAQLIAQDLQEQNGRIGRNGSHWQ